MRASPFRLLSGSLLLTSLAAAPQLRAATESYAIDPVHTRVGFQVSHAGFSNPLGSFSGSHGRLDFDEADWSAATVDVVVPVATLDLGDADWNTKILDATFFNAKKFPDAHFVSTQVEKTGERTARITGELSLLGQTHPVVLEATFNVLKRHPLTLRRTIGFSATGKFSRAAFGMDAWKNLVGDEVSLIIEIEATRQRGDTKEPANADPQ
jgi:polyisoprenoid-binding protein YceI